MFGKARFIVTNERLTILWVYQLLPLPGLKLFCFRYSLCSSLHWTNWTTQYPHCSRFSIVCSLLTILLSSSPAILCGFWVSHILHIRCMWTRHRWVTICLSVFRTAFRIERWPSQVTLSIWTPSEMRFCKSSSISSYHSLSVNRYNCVNLMLLFR